MNTIDQMNILLKYYGGKIVGPYSKLHDSLNYLDGQVKPFTTTGPIDCYYQHHAPSHYVGVRLAELQTRHDAANIYFWLGKDS